MPDKKDAYQTGNQPGAAPQAAAPQAAAAPEGYGGGYRPPSQESIDLLTKLLQEFARQTDRNGSRLPPEVERDIAIVLAAFESITRALALADSPIVVSGVNPPSGSDGGGTATVIAGSHFIPGATVRFGKNAATDVTVVSLSEIHAKTPPGPAGTVPVIVESIAGTASLANGYSYTSSTSGR